MSIQGQVLYKGHFTSDGNPRTIDFPGDVTNYFQMNWTQWNSTANPGVLKRAWFHDSMPNGSYLGVKNTDAAATDESILALTGGFTRIAPDNVVTFAATAITAVTQANPAQITSAGHGLLAGDLIYINNVTGMQQISGWVFRVRSIVDPNNFTIYLDSSGFAAPGTGGTVRKGVDPLGFFPQHNYISAITQAANCVVTVTWALPSTNFPVGSKWRFNVPAVNGMVEIDGLLGTVLAASDVANTVTFDIDTTGFTAFALPASAGVPYTFPQVTPVGEDNTILAAAVTNDGFRGLELGTAVVGVASDEIKWWACKGELINLYH